MIETPRLPEIKPSPRECKLGEIADKRHRGEIPSTSKLDKPIAKEVNINPENSHCPIEGHGGHWEDKRGNSEWKPDPNEVPQKSNPEGQTWKEILNKYGIEGIEYKDGEPDFSEVSKGNVEIEDFSDDRVSNFSQADEKLAEQRGCTPEEVAAWRKEHGYTWHECKDCKTMQKVPSEVHNNVSHSGGIAETKASNSAT